jgi:hypothetical protein
MRAKQDKRGKQDKLINISYREHKARTANVSTNEVAFRSTGAMAPSRKPNAWMQRNAARVRIWIEEGVIDNAESDHLSQCVFDRMTAHERVSTTSRRVITEYNEEALENFP